jgi:hypothetical protein
MTNEELQAIKRRLPCDALRYYGKPQDKMTFEERLEFSYTKQLKEEKELALKRYEFPEGLDENGMLDFIYLRSCYSLNVKPMGNFEGNALICAEVMQRGGNIIDMYKAGADAVYAACLSGCYSDEELDREIIGAHIPF